MRENNLKRVKVLLVQDQYDDDRYSYGILRDSVSEWEEISDEDFKYIQDNFHRSLLRPPNGFRYTLLVDDDTLCSNVMISIKKAIKDSKDADKAAVTAFLKKKEEKLAAKQRKHLQKQNTEFDSLVTQHGKQEAMIIWNFLNPDNKRT